MFVPRCLFRQWQDLPPLRSYCKILLFLSARSKLLCQHCPTRGMPACALIFARFQSSNTGRPSSEYIPKASQGPSSYLSISVNSCAPPSTPLSRLFRLLPRTLRAKRHGRRGLPSETQCPSALQVKSLSAYLSVYTCAYVCTAKANSQA